MAAFFGGHELAFRLFVFNVPRNKLALFAGHVGYAYAFASGNGFAFSRFVVRKPGRTFGNYAFARAYGNKLGELGLDNEELAVRFNGQWVIGIFLAAYFPARESIAFVRLGLKGYFARGNVYGLAVGIFGIVIYNAAVFGFYAGLAVALEAYHAALYKAVLIGNGKGYFIIVRIKLGIVIPAPAEP